jgi:hypothetical protein
VLSKLDNRQRFTAILNEANRANTSFYSVQGTSFTFVGPALAAGAVGGIPLMLGMSILAAPLEIILSFVLGFARRLFEPVVTGTSVMMIGFSLIHVGMTNFAGGADAKDFGSARNLSLGLLVIVDYGVQSIRPQHRPDWRRHLRTRRGLRRCRAGGRRGFPPRPRSRSAPFPDAIPRPDADARRPRRRDAAGGIGRRDRRPFWAGSRVLAQLPEAWRPIVG